MKMARPLLRFGSRTPQCGRYFWGCNFLNVQTARAAAKPSELVGGATSWRAPSTMAQPEGIEFNYASSFARVVEARQKRLPASLPKKGGGQGYDAGPAVAAAAVRSGSTPRGAASRDEVPWIKSGRLPAATLPATRHHDCKPVMRDMGVDAGHAANALFSGDLQRVCIRGRSESPERQALKLQEKEAESSPERPSLPHVAVHHHVLPPPELTDRAWSTPLEPQPTERKEAVLTQSTHRTWSASSSEAGGWRVGQASARKSARRAEPTVLQQWAAKNQGTARLRPTGGAATPWVAPGATPGGAEELCLECNVRFEAAFAAGEAAKCSAMLQSARQLVERGLVLDSPGPGLNSGIHLVMMILDPYSFIVIRRMLVRP